MNSKNTICLLALACAFATGARAQNIESPKSEAETNDRISNRAQLTSAPTIYIWMLDAEVEYDENNQPVKPKEYKNTTGDKNDNYYLVKLRGGSSYDTPISNNIIAEYPDSTNNVALRANYASWETKTDEYRLARIKVVDAAGSIKSRDELTTIRGRGNSTWDCPKKSYRLKFPSKTKFLAKEDGTNEYADAKNWTLLANAADRSMMRNALSTEVGRRYESKTGLKSLPFYPAYKFVDLVLNNVYIGTYQISDHVQIQTGRIEIDEDRGWFLEGVSTEDKFVEDPHLFMSYNGQKKYVINVKNPEDNYYTEEVKQSITDYLSAAYSCTFTKDFSEATGLFKYVDLESAVAYFICSEVSGNYDGLISNYAYRDINPGDKLKLGPVWDADIAYGNFGNLTYSFIYEGGKNYTTGSYYPYLRESVKNLVENSPEFVKLLNERWDVVYSDQPGNWPYDNGLTNHLYFRIKDMYNALVNSQQLNYSSKGQGGADWSLDQPIMSWVGGSFVGGYEKLDENGEVNPADFDQDYVLPSLRGFIYNHNHWLNTAIHQLKKNMKADAYTLDAEATTDNLGQRFGKICDVQIQNRTFKAGEWNTICLPFSLTYDQLKATFGNDVQLLEYSGINGTTMMFTPAPANRLVAGIPYVIYFTGSNVANPKFTEMAISCRTPVTVSYEANSNYKFVGTFFKTNVSTDGKTLLLDAGDEAFEANTTAGTLTGLSAYVSVPAGVRTVPLFFTATLFDAADNTETLATLDGKTVNVKLEGRMLYKDGYWNTLCLPFRLESLDDTPLAGATVMGLTGTTLEGTTLVVDFESTSRMEAGIPYLLKWEGTNGSIDSPTFHDVTITQTADKAKSDYMNFIGTFSPFTLKADNRAMLYLGAKNTLYYPSEDVTVNSFRGYFKLKKDLTAGDIEPKSIRSFELVFDGEETAITSIIADESLRPTDESWYTLDGRRLSSEPTAPGIYINRGRKVVIK